MQSLLEDQRSLEDALGHTLPDLPFKENWIDHVFKEVIDHELESGAKNIAWAPSYIQHWSWGERDMFPVLDAEMKKTAIRVAKEYGADVIDDEIFITFQYGNVNAKERILLDPEYGALSAGGRTFDENGRLIMHSAEYLSELDLPRMRMD